MHFVQAPHEIGTAVAEPASAVQPTAEAQRQTRGGDYFHTQDSEELSEEAESLNDRWWDLEQEGQALGDPYNLVVVRHNISRSEKLLSTIPASAEINTGRGDSTSTVDIFPGKHERARPPQRSTWKYPTIYLITSPLITRCYPCYTSTAQTPEEGPSTPLLTWPISPSNTPIQAEANTISVNKKSVAPREAEPRDETSEEWTDEVHRQQRAWTDLETELQDQATAQFLAVVRRMCASHSEAFSNESRERKEKRRRRRRAIEAMRRS